MAITTWRKEITAEMEQQDESWDDVEDQKGSAVGWLDLEFDNTDGFVAPVFTVWTKKRVYSPAMDFDEYSTWCTSVPRNPCDETSDYMQF